MMVSARRNMGMDRLQAEVERFARKTTESSEASKPKKKDIQITTLEKSEQTKKEIQQTKPTPTIKTLWRKDEERKKKMLEKKQKEQEGSEEDERKALDRDKQGKEYLPNQRFQKGIHRSKIKT
jgi:hypothetical protein